MTLKEKYFNKLKLLIYQQECENKIEIITTPLELEPIKFDSKIVNDKSNYWYS